jgi:hypothetical protein
MVNAIHLPSSVRTRVQEEALVFEYDPAVHGVHEADPSTETDPAAHCRHTQRVSPVTCMPIDAMHECKSSKSSQAKKRKVNLPECTVRLQQLTALQQGTAHTRAKHQTTICMEIFLLPHSLLTEVQEEAWVLEYDPAVHGVHEADPSTETDPAAHCRHTQRVCPVTCMPIDAMHECKSSKSSQAKKRKVDWPECTVRLQQLTALQQGTVCVFMCASLYARTIVCMSEKVRVYVCMYVCVFMCVSV